MNNFLEDDAVNSGESYFCLAGDVPGLPTPERQVCPRAHSFTPLISKFAGDRWRKVSEGIFTHVQLAGENPCDEARFRIRFSVRPALADDVLRSTVPIIVKARCPFKVIANTALLELMCSRSSSGDSAGDFITIYPPSREVFNDLTAKLQHATHEIKSTWKPMSLAERSGRTELAPDRAQSGSDAFLPNEGPCFFGREDERLELAQRLEQGIVTVVLGQRGVSQSSLLRAGCKPLSDGVRLESVYLRLQFAGEAHPVQQVRDEINRVLRESQIDGAPFGEGQTLWEYFHLQKPVWVAADGRLVVPVLIFDHFEDVFTFDGADPAARQQVDSFWAQLANLVENRVPQMTGQLKHPSADAPTERLGFKVVISMCQNYLSGLLQRGGQILSITRNHFLLKPFDERKATDEKERRGTEEENVPGPAPALPQEELLLAQKGGEVFADFNQNGAQARESASATPPQTTDLKERREPPEEKLPEPAPELPQKETSLPKAGAYLTKRLKFLAYCLGLLLTIILGVMVVMFLQEIQKQQTEVELEEYISNVAAARNTFKSANKKLTLAESSLAIKESNIQALAARTRAQELEAQCAREQNSRLAGEQTNYQSRISQLNREKAQAESRLAEWSGLLNELTNQIAKLNSQKEELKARNEALAVTNSVSVSNIIGTRLPDPALSNENKEAAVAMESFPLTLPANTSPDIGPSSQRQVDVVLTNGQCLYSTDGTKFQALRPHDVLFEGAVIRTGKGSWSDFFIRRTGTTVRLAPESQMKIAKLSEARENDVFLMDTLLELRQGRIFTIVRALAPGSTLEISDAAGHSVIEGGGLGCYMITASGPGSADKLLLTPLRVISQKGSAVIVPGQSYNANDGANLSLVPSAWEKMLIQLDELEAETDKAIAEPEPPKAPGRN